MAGEMLFEVDASLIVAKLHLAGIHASNVNALKDTFIVNTGVVDDDPSAKPEYPKNVKFNIDNPSGNYEVGYVTMIDYSYAALPDSMFEEMKKLVDLLGGDASKIDDKLSDPKVKKAHDDLEAHKARVLAVIDSVKELNTAEDIDNAKKANADLEKSSAIALEKIDKAKMADALKALQAYFESFAGKDNVKSITEALRIFVSNDATSSSYKGLVKDFVIQPASQAEVDRASAAASQAKKYNAKKEVKQRVCYKVKYTLTVDK